MSILNLQALFNSLPPEDYKNGLLVLGGDGRYFNKEAAQVSSGALSALFSNLVSLELLNEFLQMYCRLSSKLLQEMVSGKYWLGSK